MEDKISVIVPIYNVEEYLQQCLESIVNQTYNNLEILLINDGSTDKSSLICEEYARKDDRIKVIHQENKGIAFCRNLGLKTVTGDYVVFIDSDDYIDVDMIKTLYDLLQIYKVDISMCSFDLLNQENEIISTENANLIINILEGDSKFELLYQKNWKKQLCSVVIWNKLYKKEIFKDIKYPDNTIHEDEALAHIILNRARKIAFVQKELYHYRKREGSITTKPYSLDRQDILPAIKTRYDFFVNNKKEKLASEALRNYCFFIIKHYKFSMDNNIIKECGKNLLKKLGKVLLNLMTDKYIEIITKLFITCFYIFPKITIKFVFKNRNLEL